MKYVVAVSGGVDSVVLLDRLANSGEHELVVAHFDHGIRPESDADARFVEALANKYGLQFAMKREELGKGASEALARERRYKFLRQVARQHEAKIAVAHHGDDMLETIAINLTRGTGWRGLAVMADDTIWRPMLTMTKNDIYDYALKHRLEWVEDETNASDAYLRNRLRARIKALPNEVKSQLVRLRADQVKLAALIDSEAAKHVVTSRYFMTMIDPVVASELLRALLLNYGLSLTRPQRQRLLVAIKTAMPGATIEAGGGVIITCTKREFIVKHPL